MRNYFIALLMSFFVVGMTAPMAEAKRFGGGVKLGKTYTAPKKSTPAVAPSQQKTATPAAAAGAAAGAKKSGLMGGLLGGLLVGGLLSALFFGGAFDGIQIMDILLIALVAFILYKLFAGKKQQSSPQYAGAGGAQYRETAPENDYQAPQSTSFEPQPTASHFNGEVNTPAWFNKEAFVGGAQSHFENLQKAWDAQNWEEIATYTTPELLAELQSERAKHPADQKTEVVSVMAELFNFIDNQTDVVASVHFYGWIKENDGQPAEFGEVWHLTRDMTQPNADWYIVGIEQES